jgi:hemolysin activation/secretion protein
MRLMWMFLASGAGYTGIARATRAMHHAGCKGGLLSIRRAVTGVALALMAQPLTALAQPPCTGEDSDCAAGACPLVNLPYEEFINTAPTSAGGRDIPSVADRPFDPESGPRILVRGFVVDGVTPNPEQGVTQQSVQAAADAAFARETGGSPDARLTVGHMTKVADDVTTFYRNKGYLVAKAFLPVQTIGGDGLVHIQVVEGTIADVVVENNKKYPAKTLRKPSLRLIGTRPQRDEVETALLYTQDYPGVRLFGTFRPGANTGDTKLVLQVQEETRFDYSLGADNYGNEFTGKYRFRGDAAWNDPFGLGDLFSLTLLQAVSPSNTTFGSANYSVPVGPRGFSTHVGASRNAFAVAGPLQLLDLAGTITVYELGSDWKFVRHRFSNASANFLLAHKESKLTAVGGVLKITNDKYNVAVLGVDADRVDTKYKGVDQGTLKVRQGLSGNFGSSSGVDKTFTIGELRYARIQSLADTQTGVFRFRSQYTGNVLSPLEQFALAGPDAVRAYPVGQALTDSGIYSSLEYRVQAPGFSRTAGPFSRTWGDLFSTILSVDYASGRNTKGSKTVNLSGYGGGVQFGIPGTFNLLLQGAVPISSQEASDGHKFRVYGEFSYKF